MADNQVYSKQITPGQIVVLPKIPNPSIIRTVFGGMPTALEPLMVGNFQKAETIRWRSSISDGAIDIALMASISK